MMMEQMDGELTMDELVVVSESLEPYVLTYQPSGPHDGAVEVTALVVLKRENGLLLALPVGALSEEVLLKGKAGDAEDLFGPSAVVKVPGVIMDGGELTATGTSFEVLLVDCLSDVVHSLREHRAFEEIIYGFEDNSAFSLPDPVELTAKPCLGSRPLLHLRKGWGTTPLKKRCLLSLRHQRYHCYQRRALLGEESLGSSAILKAQSRRRSPPQSWRPPWTVLCRPSLLSHQRWSNYTAGKWSSKAVSLRLPLRAGLCCQNPWGVCRHRIPAYLEM